MCCSISEDSSEIVFLLVENYQLTALDGLTIVKEFLENNISCYLFFSLMLWLLAGD